MLPSWGLYFGLSMIEDIMFTQIVKIMILNVLSIIAVLPQLRVIRRVIKDKSMELIQGLDELRPVDALHIVQRFSPTCRAARSSELYDLPSAKVLRSLSDQEMNQCHEVHLLSAGGVVLCLILIPMLLATISTTFLTNLMDMVLYTALDVFLIVADVVFLASISGLIAASVVVGAATVYYYGIYAPAVRHAARMGVKYDNIKNVGFVMAPTRAHTRQRSLWRKVIHGCYEFLDLFAFLHVVFSPFERRRLRQQKIMTYAMAWRAMNTLGGQNQSRTLSRLEQLMTEDVEEIHNTNEGNTNVPQSILALMPTGQSTSQQKVGLGLRKGEQRWLHKIFDVPRPPPTSSQLHPPEFLPVLHTNLVRESVGVVTAPALLYRQKHTATNPTIPLPKITDNIEIALQSMFKRHALMMHQSSSLDPPGIMSRVDAELLIQWVWDQYHPGWKPVTEALQKQCDSRLERWWEKCLLPNAPDVVLIGTRRTRVGVTYAGFTKWFTSCMHELIKARDMFPLPYEGWFEEDNEDDFGKDSDDDDDHDHHDGDKTGGQHAPDSPSQQERLIESLARELHRQQQRQQPQQQPSLGLPGNVTPGRLALPPMSHVPVPVVEFHLPRGVTNHSNVISHLQEDTEEVHL